MGHIFSSCLKFNIDEVDIDEQYVIALVRLDGKGNTNNIKFTLIYDKKKEMYNRGQIVDISMPVSRATYIKLVNEYNTFCRTNTSNVWICPLDIAKNMFYELACE